MAGAQPLNPTNANRYAYTGDNPINATDPTGLTIRMGVTRWHAMTYLMNFRSPRQT